MRTLLALPLALLLLIPSAFAACDSACALGATNGLARANLANAATLANGGAGIAFFEVVAGGAFVVAARACAAASDPACGAAPAADLASATATQGPVGADIAGVFVASEIAAAGAYQAALLS